MRDVDKLIYNISQDIKEQNGRVFYVGGYVRDILLGLESKDIDLEIYGITAGKLEEILAAYGEVIKVGASFGVYMIKGFDIDFALPRKERKIGDKHIDFDVSINPFITYEAACQRRDFTMNAIMMDVLTCEIIDPFDGQNDIKEKVIRHVDAEKFVEDELRGLRMCQFASRFGFLATHDTKTLVRGFDYQHLPKERIFEEVKKALLKSEKPSMFFYMLAISDITKKLFPSLDALTYCEQDPRWHAEGSVWTHTMMVLDELAKIKHKSKDPLALMFAGLLHDIGKPPTRKVSENGGVTFYGHEKTGSFLASQFMQSLTNDKKLHDKVVELVGNHMRPNNIVFTGSDKAVRKLMLTTDIHEQLLLSQADHLGRISGCNESMGYKEQLKWFQDKIETLQTETKEGRAIIKPIVTGKDLIELGLKPGPQFKKMLDYAMDLQLEGEASKKVILYQIVMEFMEFDFKY